MARSRIIKPGFFLNEELGELDPIARILFVGLWTAADREGRLENRPKRLKAQLLPYDDCDIALQLNALGAAGFIEFYGDKSEYIQIVNFSKHQSCHLKESASKLPAPDKHRASTVQAPDKHHTSRPITTSTSTSTSEVSSATADSSTCVDLTGASTRKAPDKHGASKMNGVPFGEIVDLYHEILPDLPRVAKVTETRKRQIRALWTDPETGLPDLNHWRNFFTHVSRCDFLTGKAPSVSNPNWRADLQWITKPENYLKIYEGKYDR